VTAEEMVEFVRDKGTKVAAEQVDVVTTGTFGPMCSSGMFVNLGHSKPRIKIGGGTCTLNDVPVTPGSRRRCVSWRDGHTDDDPRNQVYPGVPLRRRTVIEDFVAGKNIRLEATSYGTDCYPRKKIETYINKGLVNEAYIYNPRNCYQNYNVAVNVGNRVIHTYLGVLKPGLAMLIIAAAASCRHCSRTPRTGRSVSERERFWAAAWVTWPGTAHSTTPARCAPLTVP